LSRPAARSLEGLGHCGVTFCGALDAYDFFYWDCAHGHKGRKGLPEGGRKIFLKKEEGEREKLAMEELGLGS
jgi:hypothetical protein